MRQEVNEQEFWNRMCLVFFLVFNSNLLWTFLGILCNLKAGTIISCFDYRSSLWLLNSSCLMKQQRSYNLTDDSNERLSLGFSLLVSCRNALMRGN